MTRMLPSLLLPLLLGDLSVEVCLLDGAGKEPLGPAELGLGTGGLLPRAKWTEGIRLEGPGRIRTPGGAGVRVHPLGVALELPGGQSLGMDARGRLVGEKGPLTLPALHGLRLRLCDGSEIRLFPGGRAPREVTLVYEGVQMVLSRRGRPVRRNSGGPAPAFHGPSFYLVGEGDAVVSLVDLGTSLYVHPVAVRGRDLEPRLLVFGGRIREGMKKLRDGMPKRSVQYPRALQQTERLVLLAEALFSEKKPGHRLRSFPEGLGIAIALDPRIRLRFSRWERGEVLVLSFHLSPEGEAAVEFLSFRGRTEVRRVLPPAGQTRSRYLGAGLRLEEGRPFPWTRPLGSVGQRRKALDFLGPFLGPPGGERVRAAPGRVGNSSGAGGARR